MAMAPDGAGSGQRSEIALHHVPRLQSLGAGVGADHEYRGRAASGHRPLTKADQQGNSRGHARHRQRRGSVLFIQQRRILEAFRAERHDPQIRRGVSDHLGDHALEAEEQSELNGDEQDGKHDAHEGRDEPQPILKQIPGCQLEGQCHRSFDRVTSAPIC
jgi:hypothetical protein